MNDVKIFENPEFGRIRTTTIDGEPWFVGKDVALALGYEKPTDAVRKHVDDEDRGVSKMETPSGNQTMTVVNESGVYSLIFGSRLPAAKRFKRWVTSEVLPSIRRVGSYGKSDIDLTAIIMQTATVVCAEMTKQLTPVLQSMMAAQPVTWQMTPAIDGYSSARCKMETFPTGIRQQVDQMFNQMLEQQALNFSMISRYCTMSGYPISSPSVKTYYQRHFADEQA